MFWFFNLQRAQGIPQVGGTRISFSGIREERRNYLGPSRADAPQRIIEKPHLLLLPTADPKKWGTFSSRLARGKGMLKNADVGAKLFPRVFGPSTAKKGGYPPVPAPPAGGFSGGDPPGKSGKHREMKFTP